MVKGKLLVKRKGYKRKSYKRKGFTVVRRGKKIRMPPAKVKTTRVPATKFYIKDVGAKGRGKKVIKKIRKGMLKRFGYSTKLSPKARRIALRKADKVYGTPSLFRKLQAQVVLRKRTQPKARKVFVADRNWVEKKLLSKREALGMTKKARTKWKKMPSVVRKRLMPSRAEAKARRRLEQIV